MEKKSILKVVLLFLGIIILIAGLWYWTKPEGATAITSDIILFYGRECPHCQDVDKFLEENQMAEKVEFDRLEVFHNQANGKILTEKAQKCGIENEKEIGVPLVYDIQENKCFIGTPEIEDFFAKKAQLK
jgi:glutaredoxin-related protein